MKIDCQLDYKTILAQQAQPVNAVLKLTAETRATRRNTPLAFCAVLDRSGSMQGPPLHYAKEACETVVRNLNKDDWFSLVVFDNTAQVVFPLQPLLHKEELLAKIKLLQTTGSTNLTGGWMLGRDELKKAPPGMTRQILLLTDGQLNVGIIEPLQVEGIVAGGLEKDQVRTTCLGFGNDYQEDLLRQLAKCSSGDFYDADSPEKLPIIFREVLQGLQEITAQNVRVRLKALDFCDSLLQMSDYPLTRLPDGRAELALGDLTSEEERVLVMMVQALPLPLMDQVPWASLEGEKLFEIEIVWDEIGENEIKSCQHSQIVRISGTINPEDVKLNEETVTWIAVQSAGKTLDAATRDVDANQLDAAREKLRQALNDLRRYKLDHKTADGIRLLENFLQRIEFEGGLSSRSRKDSLYASAYFSKTSSKKVWSSKPEISPSFSQMPSVESQLDPGKQTDSTLPPSSNLPPPDPNPKA